MASASAHPSGELPPLFGRHQVVEELLALLQRGRGGDGRFVLLVGEGGVGKTTILRAAAEMGRQLGFEVLEGRASAAELPEPFSLLRELLLAAHAQTATQEERPPEPAPTLPMFLAPFEADATGDLARATGLAEPGADAAEADRLLQHLSNPLERLEANRNALFNRLGEFFLRVASQHPLLLVLDDLHFGDDSTLAFLAEFLPHIPEHRLVLLGGVTTPAESPTRTRAALDALTSSAATTRLPIPAMTEPELAEFVRWLLRGRDPGRDAVMRWFTQTEGNPLFAEYLVRASSGFLQSAIPGAEGTAQDLGELLRSRVRSLPEREQRLLVYGSVLGREFEFPILALAAGQEEERLSEALDHLVHMGLLREKGGEVYEFMSERARADVYAQLTETRRRLLHRKVAHALESRQTGRPAEVYELARQFYLGRDDAKAVEYNRRATELAANAYAFDTAVVHLERALEALRRTTPRDLGQEILVLVELGRYRDELGDLHRSEEVLLDAVARARTDPARESELALALLGLAQTRGDLTQYVSSRELASEAFAILDRLGNTRGLLTAHHVLGIACWRMGDLAAAERHQREELTIAEQNGTPVELGHALIDLANTFTLQGAQRAHEAMALYERAAGLFAKTEDHSAHARVLMNLALLFHYDHRPDEALKKMLEALSAAERSRSKVWLGYCLLNLAQFYAERRDLVRAREALERSSALLEPQGDQLAHQQLTMIRGMVALEAGELEAASEHYREATRLARELDLTAEAAEMEFRAADLEARRGHRDLARQHFETARAAGIEKLRADLFPRLDELAKELELPPPAPQS